MKALLLGMALVVASAATAVAAECPAVHAEVQKMYGKRFDKQASTIRQADTQAMMLEKAGKKQEAMMLCEKIAKDGGLMLKK